MYLDTRSEKKSMYKWKYVRALNNNDLKPNLKHFHELVIDEIFDSAVFERVRETKQNWCLKPLYTAVDSHLNDNETENDSTCYPAR